MAQQAATPQREPSMDEILASIRRIIEESEPDRATADLSAIEQLTGGPGPVANDPLMGAAEPSAETMVSAESAAGLRVEPVFDGQPDPDILSSAFDPDVFSLDAELDTAFRHSEDEAAEVVTEGGQRHSENLATVMAASAAEGAKAIISEQTGRQVAASFGDLAEAFAANRRRTLDEVAEEMMRPMLQEWMDNNLPTLVEKLVREEIERVARGS